MSDRCEPPPELRSVDGWHIVKCADEYRTLKWIAYLGQWDIHPEHVPCALSSELWTYCFCLPTATELAAAKEREAALVEALRALFLTPIPKGHYQINGRVVLADMMAFAKAETVLDTLAPRWRTAP